MENEQQPHSEKSLEEMSIEELSQKAYKLLEPTSDINRVAILSTSIALLKRSIDTQKTVVSMLQQAQDKLEEISTEESAQLPEISFVNGNTPPGIGQELCIDSSGNTKTPETLGIPDFILTVAARAIFDVLKQNTDKPLAPKEIIKTLLGDGQYPVSYEEKEGLEKLMAVVKEQGLATGFDLSNSCGEQGLLYQLMPIKPSQENHQVEDQIPTYTVQLSVASLEIVPAQQQDNNETPQYLLASESTGQYERPKPKRNTLKKIQTQFNGVHRRLKSYEIKPGASLSADEVERMLAAENLREVWEQNKKLVEDAITISFSQRYSSSLERVAKLLVFLRSLQSNPLTPEEIEHLNSAYSNAVLKRPRTR